MRKILSLLSLTALFFVAACEDVEIPDVEIPASLEIPQESLEYFTRGISFSASSEEDALTVKIAFTSSLDWSASIVDADGNKVPWLTVSPTSGKAGSAEVTVTAQDNTVEQPRSAMVTVTCGDITKSINVTQAAYTPARVEVEYVDLNKTNLELVPGETEQITATVLPYNATDQTVTWSSSDTNIATVKDGLVTAVNIGEAIITAKAGNQNGECKVSVVDPSVMRAVDLGLNVKWGSWNLGATAPEDYGDYYAWGETEPYYSSLDPLTWRDDKPNGYAWESYKWSDDNGNKFTKYVPSNKSDYWGGDGSPDGKNTLDPEDDAAHVKLGGNWRMPTDADWTKLRNNCTWEWTSDYNGTGVAGVTITSKKNGKSIFLPAAGYRWSTKEEVYHLGDQCLYWSSTVEPDYPNSAYYWYISSAIDYRRHEVRYEGLSIRPVSD